MIGDKVTCWLWYGDSIVAAVRLPAGASDDTARSEALMAHRRNPTLYADFPVVCPYEQEGRILRARVKRYYPEGN